MDEIDNGRKRLRKSTKTEEDRLSALPDEILIEILSLFSINSAAATSVLSSRWRYLWTKVTTFNFNSNKSKKNSRKITDILGDILQQLTSSKLHTFNLQLHSLCKLLKPCVAESCLREICRRKPDHIKVNSKREFFHVPELLFKTQSLVTLELSGVVCFSNFVLENIQLPNLKHLTLGCLFDVHSWLENLVRCLPMLEELDLRFESYYQLQKTPISILNICALNLKLLRIEMHSQWRTQRTNIFINAPELTYLSISDPNSFYYFRHHPSTLVTADINFTIEDVFGGDRKWMDGSKDYIHQVSKFVGGMSNVKELYLMLDSETNIYSYYKFEEHRLLPIFHNLAYLNVSFEDVGLIVWKDLLLSMHCFPNLNQLVVNLNTGYPIPVERSGWCDAPDSIPDCLVNKLKRIEISGLGVHVELRLLKYILSHATVFEELHICVRYKSPICKKTQLWNECAFCTSLFSLPRASSTCEIVFSGLHIQASSNDSKNGHLACEMIGFDVT